MSDDKPEVGKGSGRGKWPMTEDGTPDWAAINKQRGRRKSDPRTRRLTHKARAQIVEQVKNKMTNIEAAAQLGVTAESYSQYRCCNEGRALIKATEEYIGDAKALVKVFLQDAVPEQFQLWLEDIEILTREGDHVNAAKNRVKLFEMVGFPEKQSVDVSIENKTITIQMGDQTVEQLLTERPKIQDAEYEILSDTTTPD